jgi:YD repeat-containing protein
MNFPFLAAAVLLLMAGGMTSGEDRVEHFADGTKDLVYSDTVLTEEISYDADGALKKETFFDSSSLPVRTRSYIREGGRLERVEYADAAGKLVGTQSYRYDRDGRLLGVDSDGDLGTISVGMISSGAIPQASWIAGKSTTVLAYDESGRVTMVQTMKDGAAVSVERRSYGDKGRLYSVQTEDKASGLVAETLYDEDGRMSSKIVTPSKGPPAKTRYSYDGAGRLVEETTRQGEHRNEKKMTYSESGTLTREETLRDGSLILSVDYTDDGRVEELYDDGQLFVKATYVGGRKVKDEFYSNGVVSRTREY